MLRIQSCKLVGEDLAELDRLLSEPEEEEDDIYEDPETFGEIKMLRDNPPELTPRTPQPRKRKMSVYDLVKALEKALEVKKRRVIRNIPPHEISLPEKKRDITSVIVEIYGKIKGFLSSKSKLTFNELIPSGSKEDKVLTFIPLLHLTNQRKIDLDQERHFADIHISLARTDADKELQP